MDTKFYIQKTVQGPTGNLKLYVKIFSEPSVAATEVSSRLYATM